MDWVYSGIKTAQCAAVGFIYGHQKDLRRFHFCSLQSPIVQYLSKAWSDNNVMELTHASSYHLTILQSRSWLSTESPSLTCKEPT